MPRVESVATRIRAKLGARIEALDPTKRSEETM